MLKRVLSEARAMGFDSFNVGPEPEFFLFKLDSNGRPVDSPVRVTHGTGSVAQISVTRDGKRIAFFRQAIEPHCQARGLDPAVWWRSK